MIKEAVASRLDERFLRGRRISRVGRGRVWCLRPAAGGRKAAVGAKCGAWMKRAFDVEGKVELVVADNYSLKATDGSGEELFRRDGTIIAY